MKPLYLGLEAFGPFVDYQAVNFTELGAAPLFLINGATGSGKSTLLDALCFALFGQTSGKERDAGQMRCDFADHNTLASVNCIFELAGTRYKIERIPTQERAKARGEGTTTQGTEATLWQIDDSTELNRETEGKVLIAKSATKVTQWVEATLGLDAQQFRQVMILPQGKFRDFLLADSSEREKIFASLFQTAIYQRLQDALAENSRDLENQFKTNRIKKEQLLNDGGVENEADLPDLLNAKQVEVRELQSKHQTALAAKEKTASTLEQANALTAQFNALESAKSELGKLTAEQATIDQLKALNHQIEQAIALAPRHERLTDANSSLKKINSSIRDVESDLESANALLTKQSDALTQAQTDAAQLPALERKLIDLRQLQPKVTKLNDYAKRRDTFHEKLQGIKALESKQQETLNEQQLSVNQLTDQLGAIEQTISQEVGTQKLIQNLKQELEQANLRTQKQAKIKDLETAITKNKAQLEALKTQGLAAREQYTSLKLAWHQSQAAILAAELQLGSPCPVCGSEDHPNPAKQNIEGIDEQALNHAEKHYYELQDAYRNCQKDLQFQQKEREQNLQELRAIEEKLAALTEANSQIRAIREIEAELQEANARLLACHKAKEDKASLDSKVQSTQQTIDALKNNIHQLAIDKQAVASDLNHTQEQFEQLAQEVTPEFRQPRYLENSIAKLEADIQNLQTTLKTCQEAVQAAKLQNAQLQSQLAERKQVGQTQQQTVTQLEREWQAALDSSPFDTQADFDRCLAQRQGHTNIKQRIEVFEKALNTQTAKYETLIAQLQNHVKPDVAQLQQSLQDADSVYQQALEAWTSADHQLKSLQQLQKSLQRLAKDSEALDKQYATVGTLADVANGKKGQKISLQRFVLGVLLDDVLIEASHRLLHMSKGRYRLLRNLDRAKGNKASGLEIYIEDNYTGKTRSAATLSGGESFMAALSLALGLSDVVQAYAGGIQLDALFIDEGFGSLDTDALDLAIHTLLDLQSSGKMIGLISHVTELKEQMAQRIDIISSPTGSSISLRTI